jgi:hypothetical protein
MFAVLIAIFTTALVALVLTAHAWRRRAPRPTPHLRHPARGVGAALSILLLSGAGLFVAFGAASAETVTPRDPWAIQPTAPVWTPPQLETLAVETLPAESE